MTGIVTNAVREIVTNIMLRTKLRATATSNASGKKLFVRSRLKIG